MPSTALTMPSSVSNETRRSSALNSGSVTAARPRLPGVSRVPDPWIKVGVRDVDDDIRDDDEHGREQHGPLDDRDVRVDDRAVVEAADARDVEDGLGQHRAAEQRRD